MLEVARWLLLQLAAFLSVLLVASGVHKLITRARIRAAVHEFAGVPLRLAPAAALAAAGVELLAGMMLWVPRWRAAGGVLAAVIWGVYLCLILRAIARGRRTADCGCSFGPANHELGRYAVLRNASLASAGAASAATASAAAGMVTDGTGFIPGSQLLAALALLALYVALDQVSTLTPPRAGVLG